MECAATDCRPARLVPATTCLQHQRPSLSVIRRENGHRPQEWNRGGQRRFRTGAAGMKIPKLPTFVVPPRWLFLKIETDEGVTGWGEPVVEGRAATVAAAVNELSDYLIGQDPRKIEDHWQVMYRAGFYRGGAILKSAIR